MKECREHFVCAHLRRNVTQHKNAQVNCHVNRGPRTHLILETSGAVWPSIVEESMDSLNIAAACRFHHPSSHL